MIQPAKLDLVIYQGSTFFKRFTWKDSRTPIDITGYTFRMQIRPSIESETILADLAALNTNASTTNFLRGDGTWVTPPNTNTTYSEISTAEIDAGTASTRRTISGRRMQYALDKKADTVHGHSISDVTGLQAAMDSKANTSTQVIAGTGLSGGGTLEANRTLSVTYGTTAGTAAQGNDSRLSNSREWTASTVSQAEAEAGTSTTRRAWTSQRVRQAITGWWDTSSSKTKLDGIEAGAQMNVGTNLGTSGTSTTRTVTSSTGSNVSLPSATTSTAGVMSASDKTKLDGIEAGAEVNVATNLGQSRNTTSYTVTSSTGTNTTLAAATTSAAGVMTASDKSKLDGIESGAQVNTVTSVAGKTGAVSLTNNDVGLGNVTNDEQVKKSGDTMTGLLTINNATYRNHLFLTRGSNTAQINPSTGSNSGATPELRFEGDMNGYWFDGRVRAEDGFYGDGSNLEMVDADKLGGQESSYYVSQEEAQDNFTMLFALGG